MEIPTRAPSFQYNSDPVDFCQQATFAQPVILKAIGRFFLSAGAKVVPGNLSGMDEFVKKNARVVVGSYDPKARIR